MLKKLKMKNTLRILALSFIMVFSCNSNDDTTSEDEQTVPEEEEVMPGDEETTPDEEEETLMLENVVYNIPVVVNVVYKISPLEETAIESQIQFLNDVFAGKETNMDDVPEQFRAAVAGDIKMRFSLDTILQRQTTRDDFRDDRQEIAKSEFGIPATDTGRKLNIWIVVLAGDSGDATFPGLAPEDLFIEGVYIDRSTVGPRNGIGIRNEGKQLVHEVGHFFNLYHLPGLIEPTSGCEFDDEVEDTPNSAEIHFGRPEPGTSSCGSQDMFMNFMENVHDDTRIMFTKGQKARMRATLVEGGVRASYVESTSIEN